MPPNWKRIRATNSNGENVAPTICTTICKGTQRQLDNSGSYVLEWRENNSLQTPLISKCTFDIIHGIQRQQKGENENGQST